MRKLSKLKLHNTEIMTDAEMKNIVGGYGESSYGGGDVPARCYKAGCKSQQDCYCVEWSDCPSIKDYGRKRCI